MTTHFGERLAELIEKKGECWDLEQIRNIERMTKISEATER